MADIQRIHEFALKWWDKFRDPKIHLLELLDKPLGEECAALGFEQDNSHPYVDFYGKVTGEPVLKDGILGGDSAIALLGNAIYSQWSYFNSMTYEMAYNMFGTYGVKHRAWFVSQFSRLALLSEDNPFSFKGRLQKIRIKSNNICYGPMPEPGEEVEQRLTIDHKGRIRFAGYQFGQGRKQYEKLRTRKFKIKMKDKKKLFEAFTAYFANGYFPDVTKDIGGWVLELTNTDGKLYEYRDSLDSEFIYEGIDLSDLVREIVGMDDLLVFDGKKPSDIITNITVDYHRVSKWPMPENPDFAIVSPESRKAVILQGEGSMPARLAGASQASAHLSSASQAFAHLASASQASAHLASASQASARPESREATLPDVLTWDYKERLVIDRESSTIDHIQNIGTDCKISRKYEIAYGIDDLLDRFDSRDFFSRVVGNPYDAIDPPNETKDYKITIHYKRRKAYVIEGSYDKLGLPDDFTDFAEEVLDFLGYYGTGEILDPAIYARAKRRNSEYIFCSVTFQKGGKTYYYLTDDDTIKVGDTVLVPTGGNNQGAFVKVVDVKYYQKKNLPRPLEDTKQIIRKCPKQHFYLLEME